MRRNFLLLKLESLWHHRAALGNERTFPLDVLTLPPWEKHIVHRSYSRSYSQVSLEPQSMPPATPRGFPFNLQMDAWLEHWILPLGGRTVRRAAGQWPIGSMGLTQSDLHSFYFLDKMSQKQAGSLLKECFLTLLVL